jgi:hypothetical protein
MADCGDAFRACKEACGTIPQTGNPNDPDYQKRIKCFDDCFDKWFACISKQLGGIRGRLRRARTARQKTKVLLSLRDHALLPKGVGRDLDRLAKTFRVRKRGR